jgi:hypothetical protein
MPKVQKGHVEQDHYECRFCGQLFYYEDQAIEHEQECLLDRIVAIEARIAVLEKVPKPKARKRGKPK